MLQGHFFRVYSRNGCREYQRYHLYPYAGTLRCDVCGQGALWSACCASTLPREELQLSCNWEGWRTMAHQVAGSLVVLVHLCSPSIPSHQSTDSQPAAGGRAGASVRCMYFMHERSGEVRGGSGEHAGEPSNRKRPLRGPWAQTIPFGVPRADWSASSPMSSPPLPTGTAL